MIQKSFLQLIALMMLTGSFFLVFACSPRSEAQKIVDKSIEAHGGDLYKQAKISFDFRNRYYEIFKSPSRYEYSREFTDTTGLVKDVLNNDGFIRTINGNVANVTKERVTAFSNSVNSVAYFAFLPYGLNDEAVYKTYLGETELEGKPYHMIKVTFSENGGGEDHDDEFIYWIDKENFTMDFMAYSYSSEGGGVRFRKAINPRKVEGILLQDYENYKPADKNTPVEEMEALYKAGELELLSEIVLENIQVSF